MWRNPANDGRRRTLVAVLKLTAQRPEIWFDTIATREGLERLTAVAEMDSRRSVSRPRRAGHERLDRGIGAPRPAAIATRRSEEVARNHGEPGGTPDAAQPSGKSA